MAAGPPRGVTQGSRLGPLRDRRGDVARDRAVVSRGCAERGGVGARMAVSVGVEGEFHGCDGADTR